MDNSYVKTAARVALAERTANKQRAAIIQRAEARIATYRQRIAALEAAIDDLRLATAAELEAHDEVRARAVAAAGVADATTALVHGPHPTGEISRNACGNRGRRTGMLRLVTCPECRAVLVECGLLTPEKSGKW